MPFKIFTCVAAAAILTACGGSAPSAPASSSQIQPAENKMVVLPQNMTLASAVIHPPRAKDGFGDMNIQTVGAFNGLHNLLKKQNLTLGNVMRVRASLAPGANGQVDYDGYMDGYKKFFGTAQLPAEPINVITAVSGLPVAGQQIVIEADIAVPLTPKPEQKADQ